MTNTAWVSGRSGRPGRWWWGWSPDSSLGGGAGSRSIRWGTRGNKARWFQFYFDPFKIRPEGFIRDCQIYPDVEVDEDEPGQHHGDQQLHVLLVDLVVEDVVGELPVHAHVGRDLQELGQVEGEAEDEDGRQVDHQPPPAPHPRVQRVADPAVTLNTARGRCNLVD